MEHSQEFEQRLSRSRARGGIACVTQAGGEWVSDE